MIGKTLGPYVVLAKLGEGGMGEVFRARDHRLERDVAIKVLPEGFTDDPDRRARFEREARAVAALAHPNILAVFDTGELAGQLFLVTELLAGETLRDRLATGVPIPVRKAAEITIQLARGLTAAHDKGIIHRDLKPENVFLTKDGQVKILDFGLARQAATQSGATETAMTDPGTVLGTVGYMAPEQVRGQSIDARADLFSLGAVLYEMLSGRRAFKGDTAADTMIAIVKEEPPELRSTRSDLPPAIDRIVRHCLEKQAADRFQTARDVVFALESLSDTGASQPPGVEELKPIARWRFPVTAGLTVGAVALAGIAFYVGTKTGVATGKTVTPPEFVRLTAEQQYISAARFLPGVLSVVYSVVSQGPDSDLYVLRSDSPVPQPLGQPGSHLLSVSPRGELLILQQARHLGGYEFSGTLATMANVNSAPRILRSDVRSADFAPNGPGMAIIRDAGGVDQLEFPVNTVLYKQSGFLSHVRISPDGTHIAFLAHPTRWDDRGWVSVVDVSKPGTAIRLAGGSDGFAGQSGLAWSRDSKTVYMTVFATGNLGSLAVRAVDLSNPGVDRLAYRGPGWFAMHDVGADNSWLVDRFEARNGMMALTPGDTVERDVTNNGTTWFGTLSQDGTQFLFVEATPNTDYGVALRPKVTAPRFISLGPGNPTGLSPDGQWALAYIPSTLKAIAYPTGPGQPVTLNTSILERFSGSGALSWLPDNQHVLACGNEPGRRSRCYRVAMAGSPPQAVTPEGVEMGWPQSETRVLGQRSDGTFAVYAEQNEEPARGLASDDLFAGWSATPDVVFAGKPGVPFELDKVNIRTGSRERFKTLTPKDRRGIFSIGFPVSVVGDGRWYSYHYSQGLSALYVVKGIADIH